MKAIHLLDREESRSEAYKLLSTCYYLPDMHTMQVVSDLERALGVVCPEAAGEIADIERETDLEALKVEHARLFVGPFQLLAPPYGSVYLEGKRQIMGDSTLDARDRYAAAGLNVSQDLKEAPDHIAIELEFMHYLIFKGIEALEASDPARARDYLARQEQFLQDHLGAWAPLFAEAVEKGATSGFYRHLADATRIFVIKDLHDISKRPMELLSAVGAGSIGE